MVTSPSLAASLAGIQSPNPFWLASGPPTNTGFQVLRAYEAGWGGVVWKTLTNQPTPNTTSRYGALDYDGRKVMGFNNIELISDRTLEVNLREIVECKQAFPDRALVVSLMVESTREAWHDIVRRAEDTGCDGLELNFGCPHGMNERGMGSAVGQVPEYTEMITAWAREATRLPLIVKLTPNVTDIRQGARAARRGGADAISLINTINSIIGVDLDTFAPKPQVAGRGTHGGYCGPAIKPIALNMVHAIASDPECGGIPLSGIGGVQAWQDAVEFLLLGARGVQVCTAVMHYGFRIVEHLSSGLQNWMREHKFNALDDFIGASTPRIGEWAELDLNYKVLARIDQATCIHCGLCHIACEDGAHQAIAMARISEDEYLNGAGGNGLAAVRGARVLVSGGRRSVSGGGDGYVNLYTVKDEQCVGCNLCALICPVEGCITMEEVATGKAAVTWRDLQGSEG